MGEGRRAMHVKRMVSHVRVTIVVVEKQ